MSLSLSLFSWKLEFLKVETDSEERILTRNKKNEFTYFKYIFFDFTIQHNIDFRWEPAMYYICVCTFHKEKTVYKMKVTTVFQFWKECYFVFHMKTCIDKNKKKLFVLRKYVTIIIQVYTVSCPERLKGCAKKCYTPWVRLWVSKWRNEGQPGLYKSFAPTKYKVISFELYVVVTNYCSSVKNTSLYYADREQTN